MVGKRNKRNWRGRSSQRKDIFDPNSTYQNSSRCYKGQIFRQRFRQNWFGGCHVLGQDRTTTTSSEPAHSRDSYQYHSSFQDHSSFQQPCVPSQSDLPPQPPDAPSKDISGTHCSDQYKAKEFKTFMSQTLWHIMVHLQQLYPENNGLDVELMDWQPEAEILISNAIPQVLFFWDKPARLSSPPTFVSSFEGMRSQPRFAAWRKPSVGIYSATCESDKR